MPWRCGYTQSETNGTVPMTGAQDTVFEVTDYKNFVEAYVDLTNMQAGDSVTVREYMKIVSGGAYVLYGTETYTDAQTINLLWITPKPNNYGIKFTMQQTAGVNRTFPYAVFREKRRS